MAGWESRDDKMHELNARSDAKSIARIRLGGAGKWFVKFIHMMPISEPNRLAFNSLVIVCRRQ